MQAFCMPAKQECYVSSLNTTLYPNAGQMMEGFAHVWVSTTNVYYKHRDAWEKLSDVLPSSFVEFYYYFCWTKKTPENTNL
jgi:hypothetical protein